MCSLCSFNDMSEWAAVLNATGREIALENCHQGGELPNASWCRESLARTVTALTSIIRPLFVSLLLVFLTVVSDS